MTITDYTLKGAPMSRGFDSQLDDDLPLGELVENNEPTRPPARKPYEGTGK